MDEKDLFVYLGINSLFMKRIIITIIAAVIGMMALSSCSTMLPSRFESFSNNVENNCEDYNLRQWERKNDKFKEMCAEYKENFSLYSISDRRKIDNSIVKYLKSAAKTGAITVTDAVSEVIEQIKGICEDAKALWEELGFKKKDK